MSRSRCRGPSLCPPGPTGGNRDTRRADPPISESVRGGPEDGARGGGEPRGERTERGGEGEVGKQVRVTGTIRDPWVHEDLRERPGASAGEPLAGLWLALLASIALLAALVVGSVLLLLLVVVLLVPARFVAQLLVRLLPSVALPTAVMLDSIVLLSTTPLVREELVLPIVVLPAVLLVPLAGVSVELLLSAVPLLLPSALLVSLVSPVVL